MRDSVNLVASLAEHTTRTLNGVDQLVLQVRLQYEKQGLKFDMPQYYHDVRVDPALHINSVISDATGMTVLSSTPGFKPANLADREHVRVHAERDSGRLFISKPVLARVSGRWSIVATRRINKRDGSYAGVAGVAIDPFYFTDFYKQVDLGRDSVVELIGMDGIVRARLSNGKSDTGQNVDDGEILRRARSATLGSFEAVSTIDGVTRLYTYRVLPDYPMVVAIGITPQVIYAESDVRNRQYYFGAQLVTLAILLLAWGLIVAVRRAERATAGMEASEHRYRSLFEGSRDAIMTLEPPSWRFTSCNAATLDMFGIGSETEFVALGPWDLSPAVQPDGRPSQHLAAQMVETAMREGSHFFEWTHRRWQGASFPATVLLTRVELGGHAILQATVRDVSAEKRAQAALAESQRRRDALLESLPSPASLNDRDGRYIAVNKAWSAVFGVEAARAIGRLPEELFPASRAEQRKREFEAVLSSGAEQRFELAVNVDGAVRYLQVIRSPVFDEEDAIVGVVNVSYDNTARKVAEEALRASEQRRAALLESIPAPAWLKDCEGRFIAANRAWFARHRLPAQDILGKSNEDLFGRQMAAVLHAEDCRVIETAAPVRTEHNRFFNDRVEWVEAIKSPVIDAAGKVVAIVGLSHDITTRKRAEGALRASEQRLNLAAEAAGLALFDWDIANGKIYLDERWLKQLGSDAAPLEIDAPALAAIVHPDDMPRLRAHLADVLRGSVERYACEHRVRAPAGHWVWIHSHGQVVERDAAGRATRMVGFNADISQRKRSERELHAYQAFLDSVIENIPDMIFVKDAATLRFVRLNRAGEELLGYAREQLIGKNDYDFFTAEQADFFTAKDREVLTNGGLVDIPEEEIQTAANGRRMLHTKKIPIADQAGNAAYLLGISHDITDRIRAEAELKAAYVALKRKSAELASANKDLESFAYTVSHDLRAPQRRIAGFVNMLMTNNGAQLDADGRGRLQRILAASEHMGQLIDDLLKLARISRQPLSVSPLNLDALADAVMLALREANPQRRVEFVCARDLKANADRGLMRAVLENVLGNAWKFTSKRADARIEFGATTNGGERVFQVRDNGAGFDMRYADKLFTPFQRMHTEEQFEGTGIGLATVKQIIERHGGRIRVESAVDCGTTVFFTLGEIA